MHLVFVLPIGEYYSQEWTGAIATITRHLAGELTTAGHEVTIITPDDGGAAFPEGEVVAMRHGSAHPAPPRTGGEEPNRAPVFPRGAGEKATGRVQRIPYARFHHALVPDHRRSLRGRGLPVRARAGHRQRATAPQGQAEEAGQGEEEVTPAAALLAHVVFPGPLG